MELPTLSRMWNKYPLGNASEVKQAIGGNVDAGYITNTCVVRVSYCFNYAGQAIPASHPGLVTVRGADNKRYALRVREFDQYLRSQFKNPEIHGTDPQPFEGKRGVIMFDVTGWSDATGHFDLWDGSRCRGSNYFSKASDIYLWEC